MVKKTTRQKTFRIRKRKTEKVMNKITTQKIATQKMHEGNNNWVFIKMKYATFLMHKFYCLFDALNH